MRCSKQPADFSINILNNPLYQHPTPHHHPAPWLFVFDSSEGQTQFRSQPRISLRKYGAKYVYKGSSSYVFVLLYQVYVDWAHTAGLYLVIIWTKKFMNMRDEYRMIRLSLAVIVLEFPSWSDSPLPPSSHPNGACTVSPPPSLSYIFLFLPGIWKLAGVRVSAMQAYRRHKRHEHTVRCSRQGGGEPGWRDSKGKEKKETKMLGAATQLNHVTEVVQ